MPAARGKVFKDRVDAVAGQFLVRVDGEQQRAQPTVTRVLEGAFRSFRAFAMQMKEAAASAELDLPKLHQPDFRDSCLRGVHREHKRMGT